MTGLLFILVLAIGIILTFLVPPVGIAILGLLIVWGVFLIARSGASGITWVFSKSRYA
ncbi:MAG: hypothetical protein ACKVP7_21950 [Hyphomicrobiaceae bacterium]